MNDRAMLFIREDTGERKEFTEDSYSIDQTTNWNKRTRSPHHVTYFRARDGERIDHQPDGSFRNQYGTKWMPESTQS
jgi:hypothetical protein